MIPKMYHLNLRNQLIIQIKLLKKILFITLMNWGNPHTLLKIKIYQLQQLMYKELKLINKPHKMISLILFPMKLTLKEEKLKSEDTNMDKAHLQQTRLLILLFQKHQL